MAPRGTDELLIFTGNWNKKLVHNICETIGRSLGSADVSTFSDGEIKVDLREPIHGRDVVFIQSTSPPAGKNLLELLFMISAANRAGAKHITAIIPYFGYSRQDRKSSEGSNISASDVARMLEIMGVDHVVSFDLHSAMCQGFFGPKVQVDNVFVGHIFLEHLSDLHKIAIVSPDAGAYARTMKFFNLFIDTYPQCDAISAIIFKQRSGANCIDTAELSGNVVGRDAIIVDDMVDTAGTLCKAAELLMANGATSVMAVVTHGILSGPALERIRSSAITRLFITDSIRHSEAVLLEPKIRVISLRQEIADVINHI